MARIYLEDVDGGWDRFIKTAPNLVKTLLSDAVGKTTFAVLQRLKASAPVGPEAPHMRDALSAKLPKRDALTGRAGIFDNDEEAHVALFNEYAPNHQPFMRSSADAEAGEFSRRASAALSQVERQLSVSRFG